MPKLNFKTIALFIWPMLFLLVLFGVGCTAAYHREQAEERAASVVADKSRQVPGMRSEVKIDQEPAEDLLEALPSAPSEAYLESASKEDTEARLLDLNNALLIAAVNSREYQERKEQVFLQALSLSSERNRFSPQWFWKLSGGVDYDSEDDWSAEGRSEPEFAWLLRTGAQVSASLSTNAFQFLTGDPATAARSVFDLTVTQPLLRQGRLSTLEPLTQAEQDMLYELRDFVRFQRRFTVAVLADYYRLLERRQRVENQYMNHENLIRIRRRAEALGEAGRLPELQVDRARQDELSASDSLEQAEQDYYRALDEFKLTLGIEPEFSILPDPAELADLRDRKMPAPPIGRQESIQAALQNRLDLVTAQDRVKDSERKARVAKENLRPGLDLIIGGSADTPDDDAFEFGDGTQSGRARLDADLPLERTEEGNIYRRRLVEYEQARRRFTEMRDQTVLEVTNRWRDLERAESGREIQRRSVELAEERVESTELLFDAGRATTRDVLDANEDLLRTQNQLARALVDLRIAALELERDLDILVIDEDGQLQEGRGFQEYIESKARNENN